MAWFEIGSNILVAVSHAAIWINYYLRFYCNIYKK
ncbi:MAG: hypothetical protein MRERV_9c065 [Mycoplasmataceae bacterium RV_VA103A]|nr:MAG: hypothetical protein MRERV_9c065 [Mycoplasmataceae bacterium RV_VA103A]